RRPPPGPPSRRRPRTPAAQPWPPRRRRRCRKSRAVGSRRASAGFLSGAQYGRCGRHNPDKHLTLSPRQLNRVTTSFATAFHTRARGRRVLSRPTFGRALDGLLTGTGRRAAGSSSTRRLAGKGRQLPLDGSEGRLAAVQLRLEGLDLLQEAGSL